MRSCARHNLECHTNGLLTVTFTVIQAVYTRFSVFLATHIIHKIRCCCCSKMLSLSYIQFRERDQECILLLLFLSSSPNFLFTAGDWSWMSPCPSPDLQFEHIVFSTLLLEHLSALDLKCSFSLYLSFSSI